MTFTEQQKILNILKNEIQLCKKRIDNKEYGSRNTEHFIRGIERAIYLIENLK